jgi:type VI secretion system lysozyme-like protein
MASGLQQHRVTALLFDRLMTREAEDNPATILPTVQTYGEDELRASIGEQLHWLLNTRVPIDYRTLDERTRRGERSTVDYGLPDLTVYPFDDPEGRARLCAHLEQTIAIYEPRLLRPAVTLSQIASPSDGLAAEVAGAIRIGLAEAPVIFRVGIGSEKGSGPGARAEPDEGKGKFPFDTGSNKGSGNGV